MYTRRRQTRYSPGASRVGILKKTTCFYQIILLFLVASCAHRFQPQQLAHPEKTLTEAVDKLCFSGEGKGRVREGFKSAAFTFESKVFKNEWRAAFRIPFHGAEELFLTGLEAGRVAFKGSFYRRLRGQIPSSRLQTLGHSLAKIISLTKSSSSCQVTRKGSSEIVGFCQQKLIKLSPNGLIIEDGPFRLQASDSNGNHYQQLELQYQDKESSKFSMLLILESSFCPQ